MQKQTYDLKKLQRVELEMLVEFKKICVENKLQYFLAGGTLLGAVRHKGFIPWDDDIDVAMPRLDYEKFIKIGKYQISKKYSIEDIFTMPDNDFAYCKIKNKETILINEGNEKMNINHNVWIDIFPIDNFCSDLKLQKKNCQKLNTCNLYFVVKQMTLV